MGTAIYVHLQPQVPASVLPLGIKPPVIPVVVLLLGLFTAFGVWKDLRGEAKASKRIPDSHIPWPAEHAPATARVFAQNIVDVAASPQAVWSQLIDCVAWPQWYKHCSDVSILRGGRCLSSDSKFRFKTLGFYFEPEVVTFEPHHTLVWSARGPAGTSGSHAWYIEATPGGCRVITEESQSGLLLFFLGARTRERLLVSHEEWLRALKQRAEEIRN
ncbi:MAG: SRPBCC domain-containing protein [Terracidiphilus sp.]